MHGDDDLIDAVAREMTRGEPSAQLQVAIRQHITASARVQHGGGWWPFTVWASAGIGVAAVLFVIAAWPLSRSHIEPLRATRIVSTPYLPPPVASRPALEALVGNGIDTARLDGGRGTRHRIVLEPLVIEPLIVPQMAVDTSSGVMPIEIDPLQIEPLQSE